MNRIARRQPTPRPWPPRPWRLPLIGLVTGLISGFLGVGGGVFLVPALVFFAGLPEHDAHATSIATILPTTLVSSTVYAAHRLVDPALTAKVTAGAVVGAYLGARLMKRCTPLFLRRSLGALLALASLKMLFGI
jgi:uncharacterized membrane protein YfcA